jgi:hypothetical protein
MKHIIYNQTKNKHYNLEISQIIELIKNSPNDIYYKNNNEMINNDLAINTTFICHRVNEIEELKQIDKMFGIEIDMRDGLKVSHDDTNDNNVPHFENILLNYNHKIMIINIKSERLELDCLQSMENKSFDYFFLDTNIPMMVLLNKLGNNNIAARFSEYEPIEYYEKIKHMVSWVWVDCFTLFPLTVYLYDRFKNDNKKICIVSPELQNKPSKIKEYRNHLIDNNMIPDAICCKHNNIIEWI